MEKVNISLRKEEAESLGLMVHFQLEDLQKELVRVKKLEIQQRIDDVEETIVYYQNIHKKIHKKIIPILERNF
jgi:hypothetical protein